MDKSYRRNIINRQRKKYYGYNRYGSGTRNRRSSSMYRKILTQILVSILIVLLIIILKSINTPILNNTSSFIRDVMYAEFDYKESIDKVKEYGVKLKDYTIETIPVFNRSEMELKMSRPIDGVVISAYGENYNPVTEKKTFQRGIDIKAVNMKIVKTVEDGVVDLVGESENLGKFVKISHGDSTFSLYSNLEKIYVNIDEKVIRGQRIGEIADLNSSHLHFELWINNEAVDPQLYIDYSVMSI